LADAGTAQTSATSALRTGPHKLSHRLDRRIGITERAVHRIVGELAAAGYLTRRRVGRRNEYTINAHLPFPDPIAREQNVAGLLEILTGDQEVEL
jgi:hypothetical protein